ncbi:NIPA-like protein 2 [Latimeria chalumnae]|uniref:NIPA-like protein 2 n=1 Tax=Latimeria chalumnae TaxID=7897 RepID=UPI00313D672D
MVNTDVLNTFQAPGNYSLEITSSSYKVHLVGILLAIIGNFLISIALNIQKCTHIRLSSKPIVKPYYKSKLWWCGLLLMGIGELGNFAAYGFAPATLVAPLGCVCVIGSAVISVVFLKEIMQSSDVLGVTLTILGTYILVTFAPKIPQEITALKVHTYCVSWQFLIYVIIEIIIFCILLYLYAKKSVKNIVLLLTLVALLASLTVISVKAVSGMINLSAKGKMQLQHPIFYVMLVIMIATCCFQVKFLNQAMQLYNATEVVPINFVFFTASAIIAGVIFYQEFYGAALLNIFMFLFGCMLSFLGVFLITRNKGLKKTEMTYIDFSQVPGQQLMNKVQPESNIISYGTLHNEDNSDASQSKDLKDNQKPS